MQEIKNTTISVFRFRTQSFQKENFVQFVVFIQIIRVFSVDQDIVAQSVFKLIKILGKKNQIF